MNKNPLTNRSTEVAQRSYPFINVSGEKIPPFAAMQIVGDPKNWKAFVADPSNDEVDKSFKKIEDISRTTQFDNGMQLWCDKPSAVTELFQDHSMVAFNGDSEVGIDDGGRCFFGEYPTRALIRHTPSLRFSYAPLSGSWYLHPIYGRFGAFRAFCDTEQRVSVPAGGKNYETRVANITTHSNLKLKPGVTGQFELDENELKILSVGAGMYELYSDGDYFSDNMAYGRSPTLTMRVNTAYSFAINAFIKVKNPPENATLIPVQMGIVPFQSGDQGRYKSEFYDNGYSTTYPVWYLQKFKKVDGVVSPIVADEELDSGTEVRWARIKIIYFDRLIVSKAPAKISIQQVSSPYSQGSGDFTSQMEYDRIGIDIYDQVSAGFQGNYYGVFNGTYGYHSGYYPLGSYGTFVLPEIRTGFASTPTRQYAFQYFDPDDPWTVI
jgi:hypothetical protein